MTALLDKPRRGDADRSGGVRPLLSVALGPPLTILAVLSAAVLVVLVASGVDLGGTATVVSATWLAAHLVPLSITGTTLGVLPLLPAVVLARTTARSVAATGARGRSCTPVLLAAVVGPLLLTAGALAVLALAPAGPDVTVADPVGALLRVAAVHAVGAGLALARPSGTLGWLRRAVPGWAWAGAVRVPELVVGLLAAGAALTTLALVRGFATAADLAGAGGGGGALGLVVVSALYLPNVVVGAVSVAVGPGAVLGTSTVTAFGAVGGPLPAVPVLAVVPAGGSAWWWPVVLAVPAVAGGLLGFQVLRRGVGRAEALRSVAVAAGLTGVVLGTLGWCAGGALGAFGPVVVPVPALVAATAGWLGVVGAVTVLLLQRRAVPPDASTVEAAAVDDVAEDDTADDDTADDDTADDDTAAVVPDECAGDDVGDEVVADDATADDATADDDTADGGPTAAPGTGDDGDRD